MPGPEVQRVSFTRRAYDRRRNPPEYIDEELPTQTVKIFARRKAGTAVHGQIGTVNMGSIYFSGSHYDFAPGTYSLRIIRRSVYVGSVMPTRNTELEWSLRHSREGTVDVIPFFLGTQKVHQTRAWLSEARGGPLNPIYAFGPGTLWTYFRSKRGTARVYSSLEGVVT